MGQIYQAVNVESIVDDFEIKNYVETGIGICDSMSKVFPLVDNVYGIELDPDLCVKAKESFPKLNVFEGYSEDQMFNVLMNLTHEPTLFWLDAHFPNADFNGAPYDAESVASRRIPLETEVAIMTENRSLIRDVVIMDDLRIYEDGPFEGGVWADRHLAAAHGIEFVNDTFKESHHMVKSYAQQGFIILFPKSTDIDKIGEYIVGNNYILC